MSIPSIFLKTPDDILNSFSIEDPYKFNAVDFALKDTVGESVDEEVKKKIYMWCAYMLHNFGIHIYENRNLALLKSPRLPYLFERALDPDLDMALGIVKVAIANLFHIGAHRLAVAVANIVPEHGIQEALILRRAYTEYRMSYVSLCAKYFNRTKKQFDTESRLFVEWKGNYQTTNKAGMPCCPHGLFKKPVSGTPRCFLGFVKEYKDFKCD